MQGKRVRKCITALNRIGEVVNCILQYLVAFLFCQHGQTSHQRQPGINERRQLTRENHQDFWLNLRALEKNNSGLRARFRRAHHLRRAAPDCFVVGASYSLLVDTRWKIPSLTQSADCVICRSSFNQPGSFLSTGIESYIVITRHAQRS
jgi:hypothetical protein